VTVAELRETLGPVDAIVDTGHRQMLSTRSGRYQPILCSTNAARPAGSKPARRARRRGDRSSPTQYDPVRQGGFLCRRCRASRTWS
jgi:pyocin large subunit-like protein